MNYAIIECTILNLCKIKGVTKTVAFRESGAGVHFLDNIKSGSAPSVEKVQKLASYLGVTTSELLGETHIQLSQAEEVHTSGQLPPKKFSSAAEQVALAYDQANLELRNAVRRVLGLKEEIPVLSDGTM